MSTPFANLENKVNRAVINRLANKTLHIDYEPVTGIFDAGYAEENFVESNDPVFETLSANIPDVCQGLKVEDRESEIEYEITGVEPDGTGITKLQLRVKYDC